MSSISVKQQEQSLGNNSLEGCTFIRLYVHTTPTKTPVKKASQAPHQGLVLNSPPVNSLSKDGAER